MTKPILILFALFGAFNLAYAQYPDSLHLEDLRQWVKVNSYDADFTNLGYSEARRQMYSFTDENNGEIQCVYTDFVQAAAYVTFPDPMNTEHLVPQSLFGSQEPMRSDIHVIRPSHQSANSARANYPFIEVPDSEARWHGIDSTGQYYGTFDEPVDNADFSEGLIGFFEPQEESKGDIARQIFYFYTMYPTQAGSIDTVADLHLLYQWHVSDPVDSLEQQRNERIAIVQGNRNPYIDHPGLAFDAWLWEETDCSAFESAPVDLTKSFQPVPFPDGVIDRVQVKWYKDSPQVKFEPGDSAACDIQFWPVRDLILNSPIVDGDTSLIAQRKKPGQFFFKWPIKFQRPDVSPNIRYKWRIRCACQEGEGQYSPWSEIKIFNTPDYDPETNIYTPPGSPFPAVDIRVVENYGIQWSVYPVPARDEINIIFDSELSTTLEILDLTGRSLWTGRTKGLRTTIDVSKLPRGLVILKADQFADQRFLILD